jgi:hypothetical protein
VSRVLPAREEEKHGGAEETGPGGERGAGERAKEKPSAERELAEVGGGEEGDGGADSEAEEQGSPDEPARTAGGALPSDAEPGRDGEDYGEHHPHHVTPRISEFRGLTAKLSCNGIYNMRARSARFQSAVVSFSAQLGSSGPRSPAPEAGEQGVGEYVGEQAAGRAKQPGDQ